ncbi:IS1634 family transposase [Mycoplasmopsis adleri]|uniref:IS1634 family transposase n=1 Tax=Mycoplasmopsis adleri TaxID=51362 RepID=UPI0038730EC6
MKKDKWLLISRKNKNSTYLSLALSGGFGKGYKKSIGIGTVEKWEKYCSDPVEKIKKLSQNYNTDWDRNMIIRQLELDISKVKIETKQFNYGYDLLYSFLEKLNPFKDAKVSKSKYLNDLLKYMISNRIVNPGSMLSSFKNKDKFNINLEVEKTTFYNTLDYLAENKNNILKSVNDTLIKDKNRKIDIIWYDSSTVYFESFVREGLRYPGYSKEGKFKEDQIVLGLATDENGIPIHYKLFKGNTADASTFINFIFNIKSQYELNKVTLIADRGMSTNRNIRFLEDNDIDYILSYRLKAASNDRKTFAIDESGYFGDNNFKYKETTFYSFWKNRRANGHKRRLVVTYSKKRALKDKNDRQILIDNFIKRQDKDGLVHDQVMFGQKKFKFFEKVGGKGYYKLNYDKIIEDEKFDGYYAYETSRFDLSPEEIVNLYSKQWQIESNFRALKSALAVRPIYVWSEKHIEGHFVLCFLSLVLLNFVIYYLNKGLKELGVVDEKITIKKLQDVIKETIKTCKIIDGKIESEEYIINDNNNQAIQDYQTYLRILNELKF